MRGRRNAPVRRDRRRAHCGNEPRGLWTHDTEPTSDGILSRRPTRQDPSPTHIKSGSPNCTQALDPVGRAAGRSVSRRQREVDVNEKTLGLGDAIRARRPARGSRRPRDAAYDADRARRCPSPDRVAWLLAESYDALTGVRFKDRNNVVGDNDHAVGSPNSPLGGPGRLSAFGAWTGLRDGCRARGRAELLIPPPQGTSSTRYQSACTRGRRACSGGHQGSCSYRLPDDTRSVRREVRREVPQGAGEARPRWDAWPTGRRAAGRKNSAACGAGTVVGPALGSCPRTFVCDTPRLFAPHDAVADFTV